MFVFLALRKRMGDIDRPKWAAIFLFEFVVVLLGVLAAQFLAERFQSERERTQFETNRAALNRQLDYVGSDLILRSLRARCVSENASAIFDSVSAGRPVGEEAFAEIPATRILNLGAWDEQFAGNARKYLPEETAFKYEMLSILTDDYNELIASDAQHWAALGLAKTDVVRTDTAARAQVLVAANALRLSYSGWTDLSLGVAELMNDVGAAPLLEQTRASVKGFGVEEPCGQQILEALGELEASMEKEGLSANTDDHSGR